MSKAEHLQHGSVSIVFDPGRIARSWDGMFEPDWWRLHGTLTAAAGGRGAAWRVAQDGRAYGLRHYHRGGMVAWLNRDRYLWTGLERTRAFREWRLLAALHEAGLPVPPPVAARVVRRGLIYRADLMTVWLDGTRPLSRVLAERELDALEWVAIGKVVRRLHVAGVYHADLNAHNLLLGVDGRVHLVDFDRCHRNPLGRGWQRANLARLKRSLDKLHGAGELPRYTAQGWTRLLEGYGA